MKNKKAFTLVELMAVIIIISLVAILTFPSIVNQIKKTKKVNSDNINTIVIEAAKKYVNDNPDDFEENEYCLSIDTLVSDDYIKEDMFKDSDIIDKKTIKLINANSKYEIVDKDKCKVCNADYCDEEGNKYTEVEYLESTGTQYIDTGITPTTNTTIDTVFKFMSKEGVGLNGVRQTSDFTTRFYPMATYSNTDQFRCSFGSEEYYFDDILSIHHIVYNDKQHNLYVDDELKNTFNVNNINLDGNKTIWIFGGNNENPSTNKWYAQEMIYSFKIYNNGSIIRNLIPVIDDLSTPCLFDNVEKKCYYNQGTGEFLYG